MNTGIGGTGRPFSILGRIALVVVVVGGLACRPKAPAPVDSNQVKPPAAVEPNTAAAPAEAEKAAVTVNGQAVGEKEVAGLVSMAMRQSYGSKLGSVPPQMLEQAEKMIRPRAIEKLVIGRLLDEQVKAAHIDITEQDILAEIEKTGAEQQPPVTVEQLRAGIEASGGSFEEWKNQHRKEMGYLKVMEGQWAGKLDVTDDEAKQYYDSHVKEYEQPEQIRASHILISTRSPDPNADPNQVKAAAKEKAGKILEQVKAGGDFAALAKENSSCPSAPQGGDLGFFHRGMMVGPFDTAAFALQKDQVSDLVETEFGYHIIKVTDHKDAGTTPFEEAKAGIVGRLSEEKRNTVTREYLQSLKAKATIVYAPGNEPQPPAMPPAPRPQAVQPVPQEAQPATQPAPPTTKPAEPATQPVPQPAQPASQATPSEPAKPAAQPAPATGTAEPNAPKAAPR